MTEPALRPGRHSDQLLRAVSSTDTAATLVALLAALPAPVLAQGSPDTVAPYCGGFAFGGIARDGNFSR